MKIITAITMLFLLSGFALSVVGSICAISSGSVFWVYVGCIGGALMSLVVLATLIAGMYVEYLEKD